MDDTPLLLVNSQEELLALCERLQQEKVLGVDSESNSMYAYEERLCLLQISDSQGAIIVDPYACDDLSPLVPIFEDPEIVKVFHSADFDLLLLRKELGCRVQNIFDTMWGARFMGWTQLGLDKLCARFFGVEMDKKFQKYNWGLRPLGSEHIQYARGDTHYLLALRTYMLYKLERLGRLDCIEEECAQLTEKEFPSLNTDNAWQRIKGLRTLKEGPRRVARCLWDFRDQEAARMNRPPYQIFPDAILIALARIKEPSLSNVKSVLSSRQRSFKRYGEDLVKVISKGLESEQDVSLPKPPKRNRELSLRQRERGVEALRNWRDKERKRLNLPQAMLPSNTLLQRYVDAAPDSLEAMSAIEGVRDWQLNRYGPSLLQSLQDIASGTALAGRGERRRRRKKTRGSADKQS